MVKQLLLAALSHGWAAMISGLWMQSEFDDELQTMHELKASAINFPE